MREIKPLAEMNARPYRRLWSGYTLEVTYAVGGHAGARARTGTKIHLLRIETVVGRDETATKMSVGATFIIEPACYSAKHASVFPELDTDAINCRNCRPVAAVAS